MPTGKQNGAILLGVLVAVAVIALLMTRAEERMSTQTQRAREAQLLFAGDQIRRAIQAYYNGGVAGGIYPKTLDDLVNDNRTLQTRHFLRRVYRDPMTNSTEWGLVKGIDDRIMGVYSLSQQTPLKKTGFPKDYQGFENKRSYKEWAFAVDSGAAPAAPPASK